MYLFAFGWIGTIRMWNSPIVFKAEQARVRIWSRKLLGIYGVLRIWIVHAMWPMNSQLPKWPGGRGISLGPICRGILCLRVTHEEYHFGVIDQLIFCFWLQWFICHIVTTPAFIYINAGWALIMYYIMHPVRFTGGLAGFQPIATCITEYTA